MKIDYQDVQLIETSGVGVADVPSSDFGAVPFQVCIDTL